MSHHSVKEFLAPVAGKPVVACARKGLLLPCPGRVMIYLQKIPDPPLRPWIRTLWYCRAPQLPHRRERVLPGGCMQIILNLARSHFTERREDGTPQGRIPGAVILGARAGYDVVDTAEMEELAGICFEPSGFAGLFRERADLFFEQSVALEDVWAGSALAERLR